jgi:hypothetical protein
MLLRYFCERFNLRWYSLKKHLEWIFDAKISGEGIDHILFISTSLCDCFLFGESLFQATTHDLISHLRYP